MGTRTNALMVLAGVFCFCVSVVAWQGAALGQCVTVTEDSSVATKFTRHTVTGITTPLPVEGSDVTGFIGASYLTVTDLDGDGVNEIIATSGTGPDSDPFTINGQVAIFTWDGANPDDWTQTILSDNFTFPNETAIRDMDGDGIDDIVVADQFLAQSVRGGIFYLKNEGGSIDDPDNWSDMVGVYRDPNCYSYHRTYFVDLDNDGDDDIVTMNMSGWTGWIEVDEGTFTPHTIGTGGGFLFAMHDLDNDGDLDILAPQFGITTSLFTCVVLGGPGGTDPLGDSLAWFENPGTAALAADPDLAWNRYTIDNWYASSNPVGKGMEVVVADIDNDGTDELVLSNHNHQNADGGGNRIWPSGVYYFEIPAEPTVTANWVPVTIETGDPLFAYSSGFTQFSTPYLDPAVDEDVYAVDRRGSYYDQGSPGMVRAGDVNGDGLVDLVVPGDGKGRLYYYEAVETAGGCLTFKRATLYADLQCMPAEAEIVDLDGDGDMDILAGIFDTSFSKPYPYTSSSIFFFENTGETLIELSGFSARGKNGAVILQWETAAEIDNQGFNIYRAASADGDYVKINQSLIPACGSVTGGADYSFTDTGVRNGRTYFYKLEDVDLDGNATRHGPQKATPRLLYLFN